VTSPILGSVERLTSGNTLVGFGEAGRVDEVDPSGIVVATAQLRDAHGTPVAFYRALRIPSLYQYRRP
jgi:hypothetical protein